MPIPDYQTIMLPLLKFLGDKKEHSLTESTEYISKLFNLTDEERRELLPSGQQAIINNRVGWARTYLVKAGLLEATRRGYFRITERGTQVLERNSSEINVKYLEQFPEFVQFKAIKKEAKGKGQTKIFESLDPKELLETAHEKITSELAEELLREVKKASPKFFEYIVVELLTRMDYGGSRKDAGEAVGQVGDEGIDGIIKEDRLGLDAIYLQAKRWEATVGRPELQKFVGALQGQRANKGIFITTSNFSNEALDYAKGVSPKIVLIDGEKLADLMIEHDVGVSKVGSYEVKKIDLDFFTES